MTVGESAIFTLGFNDIILTFLFPKRIPCSGSKISFLLP